MAALEDQARSIFLAALERAPDGWPEFLDSACGGDADLRARVEQLLGAHRAMGSIHVEGPGGPALTIDELTVTERPGTVIGPYKLLEQIGEGGFGVVFLAEQTQPVRRKVALKVLKPGMDTRQVVARFEAERQALAIMDHPNIAKVLDGGATPSGRPYFVMELVKGTPITEFCDQNHLAPRQRLELFVPVCHAVQHAHQKGIIHRDLKPSNVLVSRHDTTPVVKVIDFGVAKALGQTLTDKTVFTGFAQMIGTPQYMSPEQAGMSDLDVDTRSDVYSLGVLLYELLTGTTPFTRERFRRAAYDEIRRIIREEEPPKPSTRLSESKDALPSIAAQRQTEPARLTRLVRGELDWIVMKCLEKDRDRRYETANGLAMDLQRYLADEPVLACPPSAAYRLRKFARRNRKLLATTASFLALLVAAVAVSTWLAVWALAAERDSRVAEANAKRNAEDEAKAHREADAQAAAVRNQICRFAVANGMRLASDRDPFAAMLWFAEPLIHDPDNRQEEEVARQRLAAHWRYTPNPVLTQVWLSEHSPGEHAAFSPDGRWGCTAIGMTATLWDRVTGQPVGPPLHHPVSLKRVEFSRDSRRLLTVGQDEKSRAVEIRAWDVLTGQPVGTPIKHRRPFGHETFSPDGRWELTTSTEVLRTNGAVKRKGEAQIWDLATGQPIGAPMIHAGLVTVAAFSPDGRWVLTASGDNTARVWEAQTGKPRSPPLAHDQRPDSNLTFVSHASFSPDGRWVLTAGDDRTARLWDAASGHLLHTLKHQNYSSIRHASFSPDARRVRTIVSLGNQWEIHIWDAGTGQPLGPVVRCQNRFGYVRFSPDGRWLATANNRTVQLWDAATGQPIGPALHHTCPVDELAVSPDGSSLLTVGGEGGTSGPSEVRLWTIARGDLASLSYRFQGDPFPEALSPDGRWVITGRGTPTVQVLEVATGRPVGPPLPHTERVVFAKFSPDGRWLGTVSGSTAQIWESARSQRICTTRAQSMPLGFLAFSADSRRFVTHTAQRMMSPITPVLYASIVGLTGSPHGQGPLVAASASFLMRLPLQWASTDANDKPCEVCVWDTATGQPVGPVLQVGSSIGSVALSPDGSRLAMHAPPLKPEKVPPEGWPPQVWDVAQGKQLYQLKLSLSGPSTGAYHVTFSPDGRWVLASLATNIGGEVGLWETATGKQMHTLSHRESHGLRIGELDHAAFSPDSRWVVTACGDRIVRVWDVATGRPVSLMQHQDFIHHVAFSPDSRRVVTKSEGMAAQVWEAATGQPITPPLPHPDGVRHASFSLDGRWLLTTSWRTARLWDLSPDSRPTADLIRRARLFPARRIDPAGGYEALNIAEIQDAWQTLRARYPQEFTVTPDQVFPWHRSEAEACVREKNAPAAVFHHLQGSWEWLLRSAPMFP
jgi:WD40 repeat protein/serine/threonine protein kinase